MFENESCSCVHIKKINKYLSKTDGMFLKQLHYWSSCSNKYGILKDGIAWIYNTLDQWADQLGVSKITVRRAIKSLKDKNLISSEYLSPNKRNRTLYYALNHDGINEYISGLNTVPCAQKSVVCNRLNEQMDEHMYIIDNNKQKINKSYKSKKNIKNVDQEASSKLSTNNETKDLPVNSNSHLEATPSETPRQKPTIIQDMIKIWNEEFTRSKIDLSKNLARFLVSAFKTKFKSCLKEWRKYLKILKTSTFIMGEKFKLSIWWVIKFMTIDRIRAGELGVKPESIVADQSDLLEKANQHIETVQESEICKDFRRKIMKLLNPSTYVSWFTKVDFVVNSEKIIMKANNQFVEDWIMQHFADQCGLCLE